MPVLSALHVTRGTSGSHNTYGPHSEKLAYSAPPAPVSALPMHSYQDGYSGHQGYLQVIVGMDWLSLYHAIFDCHVKTITLSMSGFPRLEWRVNLGHSTSRVVSYLKAQRMVEKGYLAYLAYIWDSNVQVPSMDLVPVVREFPEIFPTDLSGMPPDRNINFCIDLVLGTQTISIPQYRMASAELKELKDKYQEW
ncbi:uncharacterized protein [Nicotiana tomentosiformis]|uniref:uncharacterized protein n=1 Tax=Nicotiana tomentosiformis TaxID=4098 RepID=UPI00388C6225